jgi:hypothetical protein
MDEAAQGVGGDYAEQPQNQEDYANRPQDIHLLLLCNFAAADYLFFERSQVRDDLEMELSREMWRKFSDIV